MVFGGGCFWCAEAVFQRLKGVIAVMPGYAGGHKENPTYEEVCSGSTGHAEVVKIEYNPAIISYEDLLTVFFAIHDPTTQNRQGNDIGPQYRSIIFYTSEKQKKEANSFIEELDKSDKNLAQVVTEVKPLDKFYQAEENHRDYYNKNSGKPYCQIVINPKLKILKEKFARLLML